jgi:hypothetical protein
MVTKLDLPCGHKVDETAANYIRTDIKNFYTCRKTADHDGCDPPQPYRAEPFHWVAILPRDRQPIPEASPEEVSLRERVKEMVRARMRTGRKQDAKTG